MPRRLTTASRRAAVAALVLALVLVRQAVNAASTGVMILAGVVALLAAAGGITMWLHNCFESQLVLVLAVAATTIGTVLSLAVGVPGSMPTEPSATHVLTLLLSAAIGVLLVVDARTQGPRHSPQPGGRMLTAHGDTGAGGRGRRQDRRAPGPDPRA